MRIYAKLRNQTFYSLKELNAAIMIKLNEHHQLSFQRKSFSRYELFHNNESALLQPLPESPFFIQHYTRAKVQKNYHVVIGEDWHYYSVPFRYIGKEVRISYCMDSVEIFHNCTRIAIHVLNIQFRKLALRLKFRFTGMLKSRLWNNNFDGSAAFSIGMYAYRSIKQFYLTSNRSKPYTRSSVG